MKLSLNYVYNAETCDKARHEEAIAILSLLQEDVRIAEVAARDQQEAFPTEESRTKLFDQLRDFGMRHKVGLGQLFGSNRHRFWWLPAEILLVYEGLALREVFPCEIEGNVTEPLEFLRSFSKRQAWTVRSSRERREGGRHKTLLDAICEKPDLLEPGLKLHGSNVHVSRDFGESGYVDLVFQRSDESYLLVEVKVKPDEIDKAIGQIMRHRELFAFQNTLDKSKVGMAIACPYIPSHSRSICLGAGIGCFDLSRPSSRAGPPT